MIINIGLTDNGLVPPGNKPLLEPQLTQFFVTVKRVTRDYQNQLWPNSLMNIYVSLGLNELSSRTTCFTTEMASNAESILMIFLPHVLFSGLQILEPEHMFVYKYHKANLVT